MSNTLQSIDSIAQSGKEENKKPLDPVQKDYEEGKRLFESGEFGGAALALHNALIGYEQKDDEFGIANACNVLGKVCLSRDENESALSHFKRVLAICDKSNDRMSIVAVLKELIKVYKALKQNGKAVATCLDLLDHYQDNRDPQGTVTTLEEMAQIYELMNEKGKAADAYKTIASIHKNFKHDRMAGDYLKKAEMLS